MMTNNTAISEALASAGEVIASGLHELAAAIINLSPHEETVASKPFTPEERRFQLCQQQLLLLLQFRDEESGEPETVSMGNLAAEFDGTYSELSETLRILRRADVVAEKQLKFTAKFRAITPQILFNLRTLCNLSKDRFIENPLDDL